MLKVLKSFTLFFTLQLTLLSTPLGLQAQFDPAIEWKQIETDDAYWLFDANQQELAEYYILQFQRAKQEVLPLFKERPRKVTIVLADNTDVANGSARVTPHPVITLLTVQPSTFSSIGEFDNYVHELLVHEYTHILNMEPVHGWMSPLYWIFGSIAHPNMILPRWYTEGLAVYTESKISKTGGRLNSQYLEGLARSLTLEKKWDDYPLSDLNDGHLDWLGGSRAYLFGGILWDSITREKGDGVIYKMNQSHSRRLPYFLNGVLKDNIGRGYEDQLSRAYKFWNQRAQKQIDKISESPILAGEQMTKEEDGLFVIPKISSDGLWMAYVSHDLKGSGNIHLSLRHPKRGFRGYKPKKVLSSTSTRNISWHPASTGFVYEKLDRWDFFYNFYDLYFYDLRTKESKRLTEGHRAHGACFSPLGKSLYYFSNDAISKRLVKMDWLTKKHKIVYRSKMGDDIRHLSCSEGDKVYFVEHVAGLDAKIVQLDITKNTKRTVFDKFPIHYLTNSHRGLLFSSPESGVDNLYLMKDKPGAKPMAITNSLTRVLQGELDPLDDGLYYSQLTSKGAKLFYLKGAQWESLPDTPPKVEPIVDYTKVEAPNEQLDKKGQTEVNTEKDRAPDQAATSKHKANSFSPWRYLYPNHWIPFLYIVPEGMVYQAMTSAGDPLGINSISLAGQWDTLTKKAGGSASYINNSFPVSLGAAVSDTYNYFYPTDSSLHFSNASVLAATRVKALDYTSFLFRWNYSQLEFQPNLFVRQGPQLQISYSSYLTDPMSRDAVSRSEGWNFQLGQKNYLADLSNEAYEETYAHIGTFWSSFTPGRSVFYLGINGSYTPQLQRFLFSPSTLSGPFFNPQITNTAYIQRGYPTGVFLSENALVNVNAEYRFPLLDLYSGWRSPPVFFRNLQANLIFDATTLDGAYNDTRFQNFQRANMGSWFTGYGVEFDSNMNVGFHVPITLTLGFYYGQEEQAFGGFTTFFNVRL